MKTSPYTKKRLLATGVSPATSAIRVAGSAAFISRGTRTGWRFDILRFLLAGFVLAFLPHPANASGTVSLQSLLAELTDRNAVAKWPQPEFTSFEASSYDRRRIAPGQPGWFANNDYS